MAIIDYGVGNLFSICCALRKIGLDVNILSASRKIKNVDAVVLPGVGNFKTGAQNLQFLRKGIASSIEAGVPLFGVCLGMQLLFEESEESLGKGLSLLKGSVLRLPSQVKIPHMGWNTLRVSKPNALLEGIDDNEYFYFVHSYYAKPVEKSIVVADTDYGLRFASVITKGNLYGTQFHPEKSGKSGEHVLQNFVKIVKK